MEEGKEHVHFNRLSIEEVLERFRKVHGDYYSYDKVVYEGMVRHITITCPVHGDFIQRPTDHVAGSGCNACACERQSKKVSKPASHFIERAKKKLGESVDYSEIPPDANGYSVVTITCNTCGKKSTKPLRKLAEGHGCNKCQDYGFCENKTGYVYLLTNGEMFKVGITNRKVKHRVWEITRSHGTEWRVLEKFLTDGYNCRRLENELLSILRTSESAVSEEFSGYTESFYNDSEEYVISTFLSAIKDYPEAGQLHFVPRPPPTLETPEQRRSRLEEKTGVPVGVIRKYGRWYFQQIVRINGKKDKKPHGSFNEYEDCCAFARHFWATGELLDTPKNLLFYNKFGLPKNITPCFGGYRVQLNIDHVGYYVGTFPTLEEAIIAKETTRKRVLNG